MTYKLIVEFEREENEDMDVLTNDNPTPEELAAQFCRELQFAYDETSIAGSFQIKSVTVNGVTTEIKP